MNKLVKSKLLPLAAAGILLLAGLGAAIPGAVTGDAPAVVEQAIVLGAPPTVFLRGPNTGIGEGAAKLNLTYDQVAATSPGVKNDAGTTFVVPVTASTGDSYIIGLSLSNKSKVKVAALATLSLPAGFSVTSANAPTATGYSLAQVSAPSWLITIPGPHDSAQYGNNLALTVRTDDTLTPGFYTISATIKQVEG